MIIKFLLYLEHLFLKFYLEQIFGWKFIDDKFDSSNYSEKIHMDKQDVEKLKDENSIVIYVHTATVQEIVIGWAAIRYHNISPYTLAGEVDKIKKYRKNMNAIKLQKTDELIDFLKTKEKFCFLISPEGNTQYTEKIRTGYYYIARETNASIYYYYQDFSNQTHTVKKLIDKKYINQLSLEECNQIITKEFSKSNPLYYENCYFCKSTPKPTSVINLDRSILLPLLRLFYIIIMTIIVGLVLNLLLN